jgi:hypothetical protein
MRHRSFHDSSGRGWTVSEVTKGLPTFAARSQLGDAGRARGPIGTRRFAAGLVAEPWLCFESRRERRRLARVPEPWDELVDADLLHLLGESDAVPVGHGVRLA